MMDKKRRLWMIWGIMLIAIGLGVTHTEAYGNSWNWKFFLSDAECDLYYDPDTVFRSAEGVVKVWWKEFFKTKQVLKSRGFTESEYEKAAYQINVTEINCQKKVYCRKFFMLCSGEGENIFCTIHKRPAEEWVAVTEGHATGALYWMLCR